MSDDEVQSGETENTANDVAEKSEKMSNDEAMKNRFKLMKVRKYFSPNRQVQSVSWECTS